jgi:hypothetical protein
MLVACGLLWGSGMTAWSRHWIIGGVLPLLACGAIASEPPASSRPDAAADGRLDSDSSNGSDAEVDAATSDSRPDAAVLCSVPDVLGAPTEVLVSATLPTHETYTSPPVDGVYDLVESIVDAPSQAQSSAQVVLRIEANTWKRTERFGGGPIRVSGGSLETTLPFPDYAFYGICGDWRDQVAGTRFHSSATGFEMYSRSVDGRYHERFERRP